MDKIETDETECEQWECNNIYTHCDEIWNCPNGEDEIGCIFITIIKLFFKSSYMCFTIKQINLYVYLLRKQMMVKSIVLVLLMNQYVCRSKTCD